MSMDTYVQQILIRQQIADSDRDAAMRHLLRSAKSPRVRRPGWAAIQRFVRSAAASWRRRPAERVALVGGE
jgi:hypothetical protein